jgi:methionyl-tRNA synthetase
MIARYRNGRLSTASVSDELRREVDRVRTETGAGFDEFDLTGALETVWELVRRLNRHVERNAPWELAKDPARAGDLDRVLFELADGLRAAAVALAAFVPETSERILTALRQPVDVAWENVAAERAVEAEGIEAAPPLFPRVDAPPAVA